MTNSVHWRAPLDRASGLELAGELDALGDPQARGERLQGAALGAVADDQIAQRRMPATEHGERAQHVGVALARDQVADRHERGRAVRARRALRGRQVGAEVHDARLARAVAARQLGDALAVGEHEAGGAEPARDRARSGGVASRRVENVAAVHRDHERLAQPRGGERTAHGVPGRDGVVRVHEIERERRAKTPQRERERRRRPGRPRGVGALARRRHVRDVGDGQPVARLRARLAQPLGELVRDSARAARQRGARRHDAVQDEHAHLGAGPARGQRLTMGPDAEHGIAPARVELGDHRDLWVRRAHQRRWVARVRCASRALR